MLLHKEKKVFQIIKDNFLLSKKDYPKNIKSKHWDIFSKDFIKAFNYQVYWENFLHNLEGDTSLILWGKQMDKILKKENLKNYNNKFTYTISTPIRKKLINEFYLLKNKIGYKFIKKYHEGKIGNPKSLYYKNVNLIFRDMKALYHSWQLNNQLKPYLKNKLFILEIGAGLGNLSVKLKKLFPNSTIILVDLPEVNCIQRLYHFKNFPNAKVFDYRKYKSYGINNLFKKNYDFAILPPWIIDSIKDKSIDLLINIRSMQEMNIKTVNDYINHANRIVKTNGFFYCVNRYVKDSSDYPIKIKEIPLDDYWYFLQSHTSFHQFWVHELLARRTFFSNAYPPKKVLKELHPFSLNDAYFHLKQTFFILKNFLWASDHKTYSKSLNSLLMNLINKFRSVFKNK